MDLSQVTALAALAVVGIEQVMKLKVIPIKFANDHPVVVNILLSIGAAIVVTWRTSVQPVSWTDWLTLVTTISVVAAIVYNQLIKNWTELRQMEG